MAALEAALAMRDIGGERIATTMITPDREFVYRPMTVREPFGYAQAQSYPLEEIARDEIHVDRIVAMPELYGPSARGLPRGSVGGFIPVNLHCKAPGTERVYAAGDATSLPQRAGKE